ncbi:hypothetical protein FC26_GL002150 [Paucilactobacillus vaccinostercus DSM 20634]|uniref:HTH tetR-type domain-containing protein n=1 Tax=Paucilactobacillus vaccinostercus DSM 20634 TaxID=1423813 RepID=A0A0R2A692_9LACO|nr:TetR/AcrR family transcriptional regulator [Paucilactobacillus vaccinostercus]KRM62573.1 hypothetical protein FC26_GL002150 [Paucilactobacillus vaccinostercus DSM 20634]
MYHIKDDKRIKQSAELIGKGVLACLKNKSLDDITVSDIHRYSSVSRTTFYRLFDTPLDVLQYLCDQTQQQALDQLHAVKDKNPEKQLLNLTSAWLTHATLLKAIVQSNHVEMLRSAMATGIADVAFDEVIRDVSRYHATEYSTAVVSAIMIGVVEVWVNNGQKETASELLAGVGGIVQVFSDLS